MLQRLTVLSPIGLPSIALILNGCSSSCVGRWSFVTVSWSMRLTFSENDWRDKNSDRLTVLLREIVVLSARLEEVGAFPRLGHCATK